MSRDHYKTSEREVAAEFSRVCRLFQEALPSPADRISFDFLMNEANSRGLTWVDGLAYVVEQRKRLQSGLAQDVLHAANSR